jgi:hypothetical protein
VVGSAGQNARVLAYVFWHAPAGGTDGAEYERALRAFHLVLQDVRPAGFLGSAALRVTGAPWLPGGQGYEDWYLIEDFADLGTLNEAAVAGRPLDPHDAVAHRSAHGAGGVYASWVGPPEVPVESTTWFAKAPGTSYEELRSAVRAPTWQRQLVLGPAPEFCAAAGAPVPAGATVVATVAAEPVWPREG